ncbi:hypothetical protein AK830_g6488 [Neonectria ditissima]|uniref:DNA polymerase delta subunit 3 n=1 Tax=Neonectria ditissima TaxID=78410 RepID=A0A0P7BJ04_9HYPO|nr:hypothetical protein AK830_g6488 [Neonectria ditissima]
MDEHKKFLSDRLLSEERPITYRLLSRALDVHVNTAKEMLYDFHKYQNALRADSVHATYLVYGTKNSDNVAADGDIEMSSSMPDHEALSEEVVTTTLSLAREGELKVSAIHVYSLAPHPQKDLSLLSDVSSQLSEYTKIEDASVAAEKYGTIKNPQARRRDRKGRQAAAPQPSKPVKQEPAAPKPAAAKTRPDPFAPKPSTEAKPMKQEKSEPASKDATPSSSTGKRPPALKKGSSGGIMQSFARAAALPPRPKPAPKKEEDTEMALSDDGEADDTDIPAKKQTSDPEAVKKARKDREEALRRMMDDDDEDEDAEVSEKEEEPADEEMEEAPEPEPEPEPKKEDKEPAEVVSSAGDGRRRGKRRVMIKKRILDAQGYMVTMQESGWESFSEDEAPPPTKKQAVTQTQSSTSTPSSSAGKAKKAAGKGPAGKAQGNIMSFFSKK